MPTTTDDKQKIDTSPRHPFPIVAILALAIIVGGGVSLYLKSREQPTVPRVPIANTSGSSGALAPPTDPAGEPANPLFPGAGSSGSASSGSLSSEPTSTPDPRLDNSPEAILSEPKQNTIFYAANQGKLDELKAMLKKHPGWLNKHDEENKATPLHWAAAQKRTAIVEYLLDQGADPNAVEKNGRTPLHAACFYGALPIAKILLEHNSSLDAIDKFGVTPCFMAVGRGQAPIVAELLERGARTDIQEKSPAGLTPLISAITKRRKDLVEMLIAHGADINAKSAIGLTPITAAEMAGQKDIVEILEKAGAAR